jgi:large subunit ribosomal protein L18
MSTKITKATSDRFAARQHRRDRIRKKVAGTSDCPRMNVFKSDKHFIIQLIDDETGKTLMNVSTMRKELREGSVKANMEGAKKIGKLVAEEAKKQNIKKVVFDRNGYKYHGVIKALADAAREAGLVF